ncbi:P-loop containing nucleoside triphosphate hydrolase protein [Hyaloraphidium curvatum]|nr:P-loop containing nucleoside triphosphate hydrolase protein [Hyaloraphidium curvatum]
MPPRLSGKASAAAAVLCAVSSFVECVPLSEMSAVCRDTVLLVGDGHRSLKDLVCSLRGEESESVDGRHDDEFGPKEDHVILNRNAVNIVTHGIEGSIARVDELMKYLRATPRIITRVYFCQDLSHRLSSSTEANVGALLGLFRSRVHFGLIIAGVTSQKARTRAEELAQTLRSKFDPEETIFAGEDTIEELRSALMVEPTRMMLVANLPSLSLENTTSLKVRIEQLEKERDLLAKELRIAKDEVFKLKLAHPVDTSGVDVDLAPELRELLGHVVGMRALKSEVQNFYVAQKVNARRRTMGVPVKTPHPSILFRGNPGTGKTKVARIIRDVLVKAGILPPNAPFQESSRDDLVGKYIGHTEANMAMIFERLRNGGVLFIDEAYRLVQADSDKDFGKIALEAIMTQMTKSDNKISFIFAGYPKEMARMLDSNPGISSRISYTFDFEDYSPADLAKIFQLHAQEQGFVLDEGTLPPSRLAQCFEQHFSGIQRSRSNGRLAERLFQRTQLVQTNRIAGLGDDTSAEVMQTITLSDVETAAKELGETGNI